MKNLKIYVLSLFLMIFACMLACKKSEKIKSEEDSWPIKVDIFTFNGNNTKVRLENSTNVPIVANLNRDGELIYGGIYAYDSIFCAKKKLKLSGITDVFNKKMDTIQPSEMKEYFTSLYDPFIADVLDSTCIYSFDFKLIGPEKSHYIHYIVCARGEDNIHRISNAANELADSTGTTIRFELSPFLCKPELLTVESPF